jgi:hypothetical protein
MIPRCAHPQCAHRTRISDDSETRVLSSISGVESHSTSEYPRVPTEQALSAPQAEEATEWQATTSESVKLPPIDDAHDGSEEAEIGWVFRVLSKLVVLGTSEHIFTV